MTSCLLNHIFSLGTETPHHPAVHAVNYYKQLHESTIISSSAYWLTLYNSLDLILHVFFMLTN